LRDIDIKKQKEELKNRMMGNFNKKIKKSNINEIAHIGLKQTAKHSKTPMRVLELKKLSSVLTAKQKLAEKRPKHVLDLSEIDNKSFKSRGFNRDFTPTPHIEQSI